MAIKATLIDFLLAQVRNATTMLDGGTVTFYGAGTTTLKTIWRDVNKATTAANPYTLTATANAQLYGDGNYKLVIKDATGTVVYTFDNVYAGLDLTAYDWSAIVTAPSVTADNYLINGDFDFWTIATSQTATGIGSANNWYHGLTGSTATMSRSTFALGQTSVPDSPIYFCSTAVTSVAGAGNYVRKEQRLARVSHLSGSTVTLAYYAKASAALPHAVEFVQNFGTGGAPSAEVTAIGVTKATLSTSWTKYTVTVTLPSISGKTLGSGLDDYLGVIFWFDAGSNFNARTNTLGQQSGTFDLSHIKLESGSLATQFQRTPRIDNLDVNKCLNSGNGGGAFATGALTVTGSVSTTGAITCSNGSIYGSSSYLELKGGAADTTSITVRSTNTIDATISGILRGQFSSTGLAVAGSISTTGAMTATVGAGTLG